MAKTCTSNWKFRGRLAGLALLTVSTLSANTNALALTGASPGVPSPMLTSHTKIAAQAHLDPFLDTALDAHGTIHRDAAMRIKRVENGRKLLMWITPFRRENNGFSGIPQGLGATGSQPVHFTRDQIVDWSLSGPDGRLYGNFGTRFFLRTLPAEQAREIAAILTENPTPKEWTR